MKSRKSFPLRIDPALYAELEAWAQQEFRSVNGQIEFLLRQAVLRRRGKDRDESPDAPRQTPRRTMTHGKATRSK
jgi:hypothetical protein